MRTYLEAVWAIVIIAMALIHPAAAEDSLKKTVGTKWTWLTDYIYLYADWTLNVESDCEVEVGSGISFRGEPRGSIRKVKTFCEFTTYGMGAIHVRAINGNESCAVQLNQGKVGAITIYRSDF